MNTKVLRRSNESFTWWEPVKATETPFTPIDNVSTRYENYSIEIRDTQGATATTFGVAIVLPHSAMLKMANEFPPDQSWYDEDFAALRHPGR
jgi:hypothetical protein